MTALINWDLEYMMFDVESLTEQDQMEIQRDSHAVLRWSDDVPPLLKIYGTDFTVVAAFSMVS